ncbi:aldo/keto reductase [Maritalea sp.]|uniref:aldo/keto reductase n=1 Tax=Maritalea sp. TaxID=2003361 RepID=UPI003EF87774
MTNIMEMPSCPLGNGGPIVSKFALGTMTFGVETEEAEAFRQLDLYTDHGGIFIDTADVYGMGLSEEIIGKWGRQRGGMDNFVLATKGRFMPPAGSYGASRNSLVASVDASLKRLQTETIDVYFVHGWDRHTDIIETLSTLDELVRAGKIRNIAWSNVSGWQLQKIFMTARANGLPLPAALQPQYNLLERGIEYEVLPCCLENDIALTPWSPLGGGWLTGKYSNLERPTGKTRLGEDPNRGVEAYDLRNTDKTQDIIETVRIIAKRHDCPTSHVALSWLASRPGVASILLGARTVDQLKSNLEAVQFNLESSELIELTKVSSAASLPYPYNFLGEWCEMDVWSNLGT